MPAVVTDLVTEKLKTTMTNISANARIDYIHRFSKQLVIAYADTDTEYSNITSQFLASLPAEQNTSFISSSSQLNDIQIRSRIIEQLFSNALFDPEQSLAVSIVNLMQASQQPIAIVIEHAQVISVQILHELTQLVEIAKKRDKNLRVLLTGDAKLALKICENKVLFNNKTSIVCAKSGQLLPLNSSSFKPKTNIKLLLSAYKKQFVVFFSLVILLVLAFVLLKTGAITSFLTSIDKPLTRNELVNVDKANTHKTNVAENNVVFVTDVHKTLNNNANNEDIFTAISGKNVTPNIKENYSLDVVNALLQKNTEQSETKTAQNKLSNNQYKAKENKQDATLEKTIAVAENKASIVQRNKLTLREDIKKSIAMYQEYSQAYVIQFAAFSQETVKQTFLNTYPNINYISYLRILNGVEFEVLTSEPYQSREQAREALAQLPESLRKNGLWVKAISAINIEINHYQSSQL